MRTSAPEPLDRPLFVLDENFPEPILRQAIDTYVLEVEVRSIREFAPELTGPDVEDWQVIVGLRQRGAQGLLTCDDSMLSLASVVAVIGQTTFSVVTCREAGHDPVKATGLLLTHLPTIGAQHDDGRPQVWRLRATHQNPIKIGSIKESLERRNPGLSVDDYRVSEQTLQQPLFESDSP
jgi:hypothetical protein